MWPGLLGRFGDVFGLPFMIEGIAFFLEAIFIAIYIFGWDRLSPRTHLWLGLPLPLFAFARGVLDHRRELVDEHAARLPAWTQPASRSTSRPVRR